MKVMIKMESLFLFLFICCYELTEASICYVSDGFFDSYSYYEYCAFGCCGFGSSQYCCSATWPIIGIIIGVGGTIAIVVTIVCCCRRSQGARGMVCQTNPRSPTTVLTTQGQVISGGYPAQTVVTTYPTQPVYPGYQQPMGYQPQTTYQQQYPAYPPYQPMAQGGMVGSSVTGYSDQPDVKSTASAPPMDPPPPYPQ